MDTHGWKRFRTAGYGLVVALVAAGSLVMGAERGPDLVPGEVSVESRYGGAVAISGTFAVVGAPLQGEGVTPTERPGAVHLFELGEGWIERFVIPHPDLQPGAEFGASVAFQGDTLVVGAPGVTFPSLAANAGAVYVFESVPAGEGGEDVFLLADTLTADMPETDGRFGASVALDGDTIVVGAPDMDGNSADSGRVFAFRRTNEDWELEQELPTFGITGDAYGTSVSLSGDSALVGAPFDNGEGTDVGLGVVFKRTGTTWAIEEYLLPTADNHARAGASVCIDGDLAVLGAPGDDGGANGAGALYVFTRTGDTWAGQPTVFADTPVPFEALGTSLACKDGLIVAGAAAIDLEAPNTGDGTESVYVFKRSGASIAQVDRAESTSGEEGGGARFGFSVAVETDDILPNRAAIVVGADFDEGIATDSGAAYSFLVTTVNEPPPNTIRSFLLPKKISATGPTGKKPGVRMKAFFDMGPDAEDFTQPSTLNVGDLEFAIPTMQAIKRGKVFRYEGQGLRLDVKPSPKGSSKATFNLTFSGDLGMGFDPDGPFEVKFTGSGFDATGSVRLANGKFTFGKQAGALLEPELDIRKAKAKLEVVGNHGFKFVAGFATEGTPATAPDLTVAYGTVYNATIPGSAFKKRGDKFTFKAGPGGKGNQGGVTLVILDYRKERITVKGNKVDIGDVDTGPQPLLLILTRDDDVRAVEVRAVRKGVIFGY